MTAASASRRGRRAATFARPAWKRLAVVLTIGVALAVLLLDQVTKLWAVAALSDGHRIDLLGNALGFVLIRNPGAAFSFATGQTWIFTIVAVVISIIIVRACRSLSSRWWALTLGLILGGALGNLIDRLVRSPGIFRGHVVDFIDYGGFFVGNVADIAIVVAAGGIIVLSMMGINLDGTRAHTDIEDSTQAREAVHHILNHDTQRNAAGNDEDESATTAEKHA